MKVHKFDTVRKKSIDVYCGGRICTNTDDGGLRTGIQPQDHDGTMTEDWWVEPLRSEELNFDYDSWRSICEGALAAEDNQHR